MTTIFKPGTVIYPTLVLGYETARESRTSVQQPLDTSNPNVLFFSTPLRTGTINLLFINEEAAWNAFEWLSVPARWSMVDIDVSPVNMKFVVTGSVSCTLDDETRQRWTVSFEYQETA